MTFTSAKTFIISAIVIGLFGFTEYGQNFMKTHTLDQNISEQNIIDLNPGLNTTYCTPVVMSIEKSDTLAYYTSYDTSVTGCITPIQPKDCGFCATNSVGDDSCGSTLDSALSYKTHGYTLVEFVLSCVITALVCVLAPHIMFNKLYMIMGVAHHQTMAWNTVSMFILSYVTMFCYYMIKNVFVVFYSELNDTQKLAAVSECNAFPKTRYMIESMDFEEYSTKVMTICLLISAYFVYDIIVNKPRKEYMVHHLISMACIAIYWFTHSYVFYICCGIFTEVSTVFLSMSGLARSDSSIKKIMLGEFALVFFICRILFIPLILMLGYHIESGFRFGIITIAYLAVYALNVMWCSQIARKVMRR